MLKFLLTSFVISFFLLAGCCPLGLSSLSREEVIATKEINTENHQEIILQTWRQEYLFLISPDGFFRIGGFVEFRYIWKEGNKTEKLPFLTSLHSKKLQRIQGPLSIKGTDNWVGTYYADWVDDKATLEIILFAREKLIARHTLKNVLLSLRNSTFPDYCIGVLSEDTHQIILTTSDGKVVLDCVTGELKAQ